MTRPDVVIVGSGPAGMSTAWPLVQAGWNVLMLDAGREPDRPAPEEAFRAARNNPSQWLDVIGQDFAALRQPNPLSPKFRAPGNQYAFEGFEQAARLVCENFNGIGSLALGGLSNIWGAGVSCFDDEDLRAFPFAKAALEPSYRRIAARIGVSGADDDALSDYFGTGDALQPPAELNPAALRLLRRYRRSPEAGERLGLRLGHARSAVLTEDRQERFGCARCAQCLWGCARQSVYSARFELEALAAYPNFRYLGQRLVERVRAQPSGHRLETRHLLSGELEGFEAERVVLAAGALGSTRLALDALGMQGETLRLHSTPAAAFALLFPERLGTPLAERAYGLSQLSLVLREASELEPVFGNLFGTDGFLLTDLIRHSGLSRPGLRGILRRLLPAMLVGNAFFASEYSAHELRLTQEGELFIRGGFALELAPRLERVKSVLARAFRRYGGLLVPGSVTLGPPGSDVHYGGSLPMKREPARHELQANGELAGLPGVFVTDGAALPRIPAKAHTFTIMANADRIAHALLQRATR